MAIKDKNPERTIYTRKRSDGGEDTVVRRRKKEPKDPFMKAARKMDNDRRKIGRKFDHL